MIRYLRFLLLVLLFASKPAWSVQLIDNDRISGTPLLALSAETLAELSLRTKDLSEPLLHKPLKTPVPGDVNQFYVYNFEQKKYIQVTATLRFTDGNINIWVSDSEWEQAHVTMQVVQQVYEGLMQHTPDASTDPQKGIIEIIQADFGLPPDFDGDMITDFLLTDIKDGWKEGEGFIAGYFNPLDQHINGTFVGRTQISGSNERDILYIDTYPGIYHNGSYSYFEVLGTVSHEYQHLVQYRYDKNETTFVNEGLSELSSFLCGYGLRDPSKYLMDTNIDLTGWETELSQTLVHYAKAALWTYFLYEKLGPAFIRNLTQSSLTGTAGIAAALNSSGFESGFNDIMRWFFITITLNDQVNGGDYEFDLEALKGLHAVPRSLVMDYPFNTSIKNPAHSLSVCRFSNGDTLSLDTGTPASTLSFMINKYGKDGQKQYLEPAAGPKYRDNEFGTTWLSEDIMTINYGPIAVWSLTASAGQAAYITCSEVTDLQSDLSIQVTDDIIANSFVVPYDSCRLQSVRIFCHQSAGVVRLYIFNDTIINGIKPAATMLEFENILHDDWVDLDLNNVEVWRKKGETFDIGIELYGGGVEGYSDLKVDGVGSFLCRSSDGHFLDLDNFKVGGESLNGTWLIDVRYAAPIRYKPAVKNNIPGSFVIESIGPVPFPSPSNPVMQIRYRLSRPGNLKADIYNVLGQRIKRLVSGYVPTLSGTLLWDGRNNTGIPVSSGSYFLNFTFEDRSETRKLLILR